MFSGGHSAIIHSPPPDPLSFAPSASVPIVAGIAALRHQSMVLRINRFCRAR